MTDLDRRKLLGLGALVSLPVVTRAMPTQHAHDVEKVKHEATVYVQLHTWSSSHASDAALPELDDMEKRAEAAGWQVVSRVIGNEERGKLVVRKGGTLAWAKAVERSVYVACPSVAGSWSHHCACVIHAIGELVQEVAIVRG